MKNFQEYSSVVIAGTWNASTFTPQWVGRNLFGSDNVEIEVPVSAFGPNRYSIDNVRFLGNENRLHFISRKHDRATLVEIETMVRKLPALLNHSPAIAIGFNFKYEDTIDEGLIQKVRSCLKDFDELEYPVEKMEIIRSFEIDGIRVNFRIESYPDKVRFDFNYNTNLSELAEIVNILDNKSLIEYMQLTEEFIKNKYEIEIK